MLPLRLKPWQSKPCSPCTFIDNAKVENHKTIFVMTDTGYVPVFKFNIMVRKCDRVVYRLTKNYKRFI